MYTASGAPGTVSPVGWLSIDSVIGVGVCVACQHCVNCCLHLLTGVLVTPVGYRIHYHHTEEGMDCMLCGNFYHSFALNMCVMFSILLHWGFHMMAMYSQ